MKISERWQREWCNPALTTEELCEQLTLLGLEIEGTAPAAPPFTGVVVALVEVVEPHPNADKLRVCRVNDGQSLHQIVCGAANVAAGMRVPLATVGAVLPGGMQIKAAKLRGVDSAGMLCSAKELGLSDKSDGLLPLATDAPLGQSVREHLQLDDTIIELKVTPNRGDCLSILGIARELAARNALPLRRPEPKVHRAIHERSCAIRIDAAEACRLYAGRVIDGINPRVEAPLWMRERLRRAGIRSLSAAVDVTNYVMLELGQPMHAFDLGKLQGAITVRLAHAGETLQALNGASLALDQQSLVIADAQGPVALAGVMGGEPTAVTESTTQVFLESACFTPRAMAGTARRYKLHTDSSHRFERGVDPALPLLALERATELLLAIAGGQPGPVTSQGQPPAPVAIALRHTRIEALLGYELAAQTVESVLGRLGMQVVGVSAGCWQVIPPSYRYDLAIEADLIEEIARLIGYDRLPEVNATAVLPRSGRSETRLSSRQLADVLIARGYTEAITYSFTDSKLETVLGIEGEPIALDNPIAANLGQMRTTVLSGLLPALQYNLQRQQTRVRLFEVGPVFQRSVEGVTQSMKLAAVIAGNAWPEQWGNSARDSDFYDLKADVEALLARGGRAGAWQIRAGGPARMHPGQAAEVLFDGQSAGYFGRLHPRLVSSLDLRVAPLVFELDLAALCQADVPRSEVVSEFPLVRRDLAVLVPESVSYSEIIKVIHGIEIETLSNVSVFDIYRGKGLPSGYKSVAIALSFQDKCRTLEDGEVENAVNRVRDGMQQRLGAQYRE